MSRTGASATLAPIARIRRRIVAGDRLDEVRVERRRGPDRLLERRRLAGEQAVERLLVEDRRDPEPRLLDEEPLDLVAGLALPRSGRGSSRRPPG